MPRSNPLAALALAASALMPAFVPQHAALAATPAATATEVTVLQWDTLLPDVERHGPKRPPPAYHDYLAGEAVVAQSGSAAVNTSLDGRTVKIPGFVVPLTMSAQGVLTEFLLVPYYGACIHAPPPPPNQTLYVKLSQGVQAVSMREPQWIIGVLHTTTSNTRLASAAYTMDASRIEPYEFGE